MVSSYYYVKPTGCTCYDETGVTFPAVIEGDIAGDIAVWSEWNATTHWVRLASNLPKVLRFTLPSDKMFFLETIKRKLCEKYPWSFVVVDRPWTGGW